ncbi:MAG TPA: glycosyltransferase 87 family protein [Candidatus Limnocylindria bacterium]|nr:glycosyltransferase 87 family protein [Candidatus Limnocylindria bacterium]
MRRAAAILVVCAAAWLIGWVTQRSSPAGFDFIAIYASARLVAIGEGASVTDPDAILAMEHAVLPERTVLLRNPNPPALSLLLAPLGALPFEIAYAAMLTISVAALAGAALLIAPLAGADQRRRLLPFALLAPPSTIALAQGQTTPLILLAIAAAMRTSPGVSGALLGLIALRPQLLPIFALIALADRRRRLPFIVVVAAVVVVSVLMVGVDGVARYPALLAPAAAELRPGELGVSALLRRAGVGSEFPALANIALSAAASLGAAVLLFRLAAKDRRLVAAGPATLLGAPHALLHDALLAYPAVAERATTLAAAALWVGSGLFAVLVHQAGIPVATLWLLALALWPQAAIRLRSSRRDPAAA